MNVHIDPDPAASGKAAAATGANYLREALAEKNVARIILSTGASQFEMLKHLLEEPDISWGRVTIFHLDEYIGMPASHDASFRKYLWERFLVKLPEPPRAFHAIDGEANAQAECERVGKILSKSDVDLAFIGIGENGHLAFNDPPADFDTAEAFHIVELDDACRRQQFGEGWFPTLEDVPQRAISMTVPQIMKSNRIICAVPDERKAVAVKKSVEGPVTNEVPASILQQHDTIDLFLDEAAASELEKSANR